MSTLYAKQSFLSNNGRTTVEARIYEPCEPPRALFQIVHGMAEHMGRYDGFARFLCAAGYRVCIHDQVGHGASMGSDPPGYMAPRQGDRVLMDDVCTCGALALRGETMPVVLMGHSMGSFVVRGLAARKPHYADALVLMGSGGANWGAPILLAAARLLCLLGRAKQPSYFIDNLVSRTNLLRVKKPQTPFDWISYNRHNIDAYLADPLCGFPFTAAGYCDLFRLSIGANRRRSFKDLAPDVPILLISGQDDPVGGMGRGVTRVYQHLQRAGVADVTLSLWPHMRHEPLHEKDNLSVYAAIADWTADHILVKL